MAWTILIISFLISIEMCFAIYYAFTKKYLSLGKEILIATVSILVPYILWTLATASILAKKIGQPATYLCAFVMSFLIITTIYDIMLPLASNINFQYLPLLPPLLVSSTYIICLATRYLIIKNPLTSGEHHVS
jgi:hypothetical protein